MKTFRWTLRIEVPGTYPPQIEVSTGKSRDRNAAMRASLLGRIGQLRALQAQTMTSKLVLEMRHPGNIMEKIEWRLNQVTVEDLVLQAYPKMKRQPKEREHGDGRV
jgi:hypothetical protein